MTRHRQFDSFIERTYAETFRLLEEALEYNSLGWKEDVNSLPHMESMQFTGEKMRLTTRLSEIMAWLLVQKALAGGEITLEQAQSEPCHLSSEDVCVNESGLEKDKCPGRLAGLLDRSRDLYGRVVKMDQMATRLYAKSA